MRQAVARAIAAVAALGIAAAVGGCGDNGAISFNGRKGVPLDDLDLGGTAPLAITLLGPDTVRVVRGEKLTISVDGDREARLRFALADGKLGIAREDWKTGSTDRTATISITLPELREIVLAGSGTLIADQLGGADDGRIVIAGTGLVEARAVRTRKLAVDVVGSGTLRAGGRADTMKLVLAGSGAAEMDGLSVDDATVDVAGSGKARFASNGQVNANITGSGEVRVFGRATCKVKSLGSGKLICQP